MKSPDEVLSVSQLNRQVGEYLSSSFPQLWVSGEISNFTSAASGHWYFTLKDDRASVRAVMFRGRAQAVGFTPRVGEKLEIRAGVTLYEARGEYQLQVELMRRAGRGDLHAAFLALKDKLVAEGLCDAARKRSIAPVPVTVGVITSLAAAALRDVLTAMSRRAPHVRVVIYPAAVQGAEAAGQLRAALANAIERNEAQTLLLVRGGGSLEDLWSFNDEALARMVAASPIPIISGVGHETDFTLVDFVADLRAPTPTAAAELACEARTNCLAQVRGLVQAMRAQQQRQLTLSALRLDRAVGRLISPAQRLAAQRTHLRQVVQGMRRSLTQLTRLRAQLLMRLSQQLTRALPEIGPRQRALEALQRRLEQVWARQADQRHARLVSAEQTLRALSPQHVLDRGYAIVMDAQGGLVRNALDLQSGDPLSLRLSRGSAQVEVLQVTADAPEAPSQE